MRPRKIGLLTTLNTNIGDDFIREGLICVLNELLRPATPQWVPVNKHAPHTVYPSWHPIRWANSKGFQSLPKASSIRGRLEQWLPPLGFSVFDSCDLILQCGTPVLWEGCRQSEWSKLIWSDVLARLSRQGKPVLNLGGGTCYPWERQPTTLVGSPDEAFVRLMLKTARITTARDALGRTLFASLGSDAPHMPCPALLAGLAFTQPAAPTHKVIINYMAGGGHYDWGQGIDPAAWEETMRKVVAFLQAEKWEPVLLAHNQPELALSSKIWPNLPRICPTSPGEYFPAIRDAAFGVFNRLHASVAAAGLGIPSVAIGTDTRNLMVQTIGLPVFYIKEATTPRMLAAVSELVKNRDAERSRLFALRERTREAYANLLGNLLA